MIDGTLVTLIASIAGIIMSAVLFAIVKVITSFSTNSMTRAFDVSKGFIRKTEMTEFKNEMKKDMAVDRVAMQELLMQQVDKTVDNKIKEFRNIGNKLITIDETIDRLTKLEEDFKDKIASFNLLEDEVKSLRKEFNKIRYGSDEPREEVIERRKG